MTISENDKRWLVTLVAPNKIVAPVLRDFVKTGMDKLYTFLDNRLPTITTPCSLQTLTYPICHPASPARPDPFLKGLKFKNINNNSDLHGDNKVNYDYKVNSSVDLGKLYLPDYLAKFSAFDSSMDMSAALRLLGYNNYPTQIFVSSNPLVDVKSLADDVRNNVRNPAAHYDNSIWTENFFNQCFDKLEALVKGLALPAAKEKETLDNLSEWKTKGRVRLL